MSAETRERADRLMRDVFHRCSIQWYNKRLDDLEEEIMNVMRIDNYQASELVHHLIEERENTKDKLKELHKIYYG